MYSNNGNLCQGVKASPCLAPSGEMANNIYVFVHIQPWANSHHSSPGVEGGGNWGWRIFEDHMVFRGSGGKDQSSLTEYKRGKSWKINF